MTPKRAREIVEGRAREHLLLHPTFDEAINFSCGCILAACAEERAATIRECAGILNASAMRIASDADGESLLSAHEDAMLAKEIRNCAEAIERMKP